MDLENLFRVLIGSPILFYMYILRPVYVLDMPHPTKINSTALNANHVGYNMVV